MFVGMGPAQEEVRTGVPFMGPAGMVFNKSLKKLGVSRSDVYVTNVHDEFLAPGTSLFSLPSEKLTRSVQRLAAEIKSVQPNVVVPMGDEPLHFITGLSGITKWRGSIVPSTLVPGVKCVPSIHTAWIIRGMWKWEPVFTHIDIKRALDNIDYPEIRLPKQEAITGPSYNTVLDYIHECEQHEELVFDYEIFDYENHLGQVSCVGIGHKPEQALTIPFTKHGNHMHYWTLEQEANIWLRLAHLLQNPNIKKSNQHLAFEWIYSWAHKMYPANPWICTMELHQSLYPDWGQTEDVFQSRRKNMDEPGHGLAFIVSHYGDGINYYKDDGRKWIPSYGDHKFWEYCAKDVMSTFYCKNKMYEEAVENNQWDIYVGWNQRPFLHKLRNEWHGYAVNTGLREEVGKELVKEIDALQKQINERVGYELNVNSSKQMQDYLYKRMQYTPKTKVVYNKKKGIRERRITSDKIALRELQAKHQDEVLFWVDELRAKRDLKGDIVDQRLGPSGRMHTHFGITDTNRWTSGKSIIGVGTNMQNVPVKGIARRLFTAD
jgi:uracil-DNA glycosylase family 4